MNPNISPDNSSLNPLPIDVAGAESSASSNAPTIEINADNYLTNDQWNIKSLFENILTGNSENLPDEIKNYTGDQPIVFRDQDSNSIKIKDVYDNNKLSVKVTIQFKNQKGQNVQITGNITGGEKKVIRQKRDIQMKIFKQQKAPLPVRLARADQAGKKGIESGRVGSMRDLFERNTVKVPIDLDKLGIKGANPDQFKQAFSDPKNAKNPALIQQANNYLNEMENQPDANRGNINHCRQYLKLELDRQEKNDINWNDVTTRRRSSASVGLEESGVENVQEVKEAGIPYQEGLTLAPSEEGELMISAAVLDSMIKGLREDEKALSDKDTTSLMSAHKKIMTVINLSQSLTNAKNSHTVQGKKIDTFTYKKDEFEKYQEALKELRTVQKNLNSIDLEKLSHNSGYKGCYTDKKENKVAGKIKNMFIRGRANRREKREAKFEARPFNAILSPDVLKKHEAIGIQLSKVEVEVEAEVEAEAEAASKLEKAIKEITTTEDSFHQAMQKSVTALTTITSHRSFSKLPQEKQKLINESLAYFENAEVSSSVFIKQMEGSSSNTELFESMTEIEATWHYKTIGFLTRNYNRLIETLDDHRLKNAVAAAEKEIDSGLSDVLITPVQRMPRYRMLVKEAIDRIEKDEDAGIEDPSWVAGNKTLDFIKKEATKINEAIRRDEQARAGTTRILGPIEVLAKTNLLAGGTNSSKEILFNFINNLKTSMNPMTTYKDISSLENEKNKELLDKIKALESEDPETNMSIKGLQTAIRESAQRGITSIEDKKIKANLNKVLKEIPSQ